MNSTTTKIRPVFDGSVRTKGSPSVNDCLEKGPNLIDTVPAIINRFRLGKIGVSADIKKAFLQIALNPKDRDYLRFLWWEQGNSERLKIYRHRRVVFGITSSPFLLNATLTKLMNEVPENYRASANKLVESWYVDNLVTSVNDESELKKLKNDATEILASAKFELQEWAYNYPRNKRDAFVVEPILEQSKLDKLNENEFFDDPFQARSRVAPLKPTSICRLELLACVVGARLMKSIKQDLKEENIPTFYWTDSRNTLYWIKNEENWGVFVMNRVKEIRALTNPDAWNYVPGNLNPADIPSRGCSVETIKAKRWHEGPAWLKLNPDCWPTCDISPDKDMIDRERRKTVVSSLTNVDEEFSHFSRISSFEKIIRVTAWIKRYIDNCRDKNRTTSKNLEIEELNAAEVLVWKIVQRVSFKTEKDKRLRNLKPFVDSSGLLRVKSRILMRQDFENFRTPVILPPEHPVVSKLIMEKHEQQMHCGTQTLMAMLRENFWILKSRKTIRKVLKNCTKCRRFDSRPSTVQSAPLPKDRVKDSSIFEVTGIDLAGPLFLKNGSKTWIVLFTCAVYRAIHLELLTSLSTDNFLLAFRRFIARRGRPEIVYTDNGSNFIGTNSLLKMIDWDKLIKNHVVNRIKWKFIPPASPWWGGFWERMIGLMKNILRKVLEKYVKLSVGDIVLIETPEKRIKWPLGKIITLIPGNDGVVRLVKLRTKSGEILRPIQRIYPLEVHLQTDNIGDCLRKKHSDQNLCDKPTTSIGSTEFRATDKDQSNELNQNPLKTTRCGRVIRTPERLNLMNFQPDCG
ncbi:uncharacterized protein LOC118182845 [Stegodyphus dumicola]|uniref:uncharacterized protein LOC118182845 n=1 Tax=Stegodyphus dumicola TaxID=202533 RepID=UPI0015A8A8FF|nr:uncharacterized protein LOC118182845 [Stegodyphus dumicola]